MNSEEARRPTAGLAASGHRKGLRASHRLPVFAALVLGLEAVAFLLRLGRDVTPFILVIIPAVAAVIVSWAHGGRHDVRALLSRLLVRRVSPRWYLLAVGLPVAEKLIIDIAGTALGLSLPGRLVAALTVSALLVPVVVVVPALFEELGWRGFAVQAAVENGHSPAWATVVVGMIFMALHVPLYLPGQLYEGLPIWPLPLMFLSASALLTWVYLRTSSALLAGLMHAAFNGTVPLTWGLDSTWVWQARGIVQPMICIVLAICIHLTGMSRSGPVLHGIERQDHRAEGDRGTSRAARSTL